MLNATTLRGVLAWTLQHPLGRSQWITLILWSFLLSGVMVQFGDQIARTTNLDSELNDQGAYIRVAEQNRPAWWPTVTDGIRNPLFPWVLSKLSGSDTEAMFREGLQLNVRLGGLLVVILTMWAGRRFAWLPAIMFATIATAVVLPISTYVGTEVLFYGLFFAAWMLAFDLFERLTFPRCALFGVTLAFAYLAKPGVTLLTGCFVIVGSIVWLLAGKKGQPPGWLGIRPLIGAGIAIGVFALLILPRAVNAWQQFRDPLQNTAARCFWADEWKACYPILGNLNPRFIERIPADERPSASRYFARHGLAGAWKRLNNGFLVQSENVFSPDRKNLWFDRKPSAKRPVRRIFPYRGFLLLPPAALGIAFWVANRRRGPDRSVSLAARAQIAFALLLVLLSFAAFSWYSVIAPGARFIMALYLPVLASLMLAVEALRRQLAARWSDYLAGATWLGMFAFVLSHLTLIATHPFFDRLKGAF